MMRHIKGGSSYQSQNELRVHFGMGSARMADKLEVLWPGGEITMLEQIEANQILTVTEGRGITDKLPFKKS
jgi:hypothetical protein